MIAGLAIPVGLGIYHLVGNSSDATTLLEEKYGVERVEWDRGSKVREETLIVDGRDISRWCTVTDVYGDKEELAIRCTRDLGFDRMTGD